MDDVLRGTKEEWNWSEDINENARIYKYRYQNILEMGDKARKKEILRRARP